MKKYLGSLAVLALLFTCTSGSPSVQLSISTNY